MSVKVFNASITFDTDGEHPDSQNERGMVFSDTYRIDSNYMEPDMMREYIEEDMRLVAGGGYNDKHITNVTISIKEQ